MSGILNDQTQIDNGKRKEVTTPSSSSPTPATIIRNISMPNRSIKTFDGQGYEVWAIHMKDVLRERKLLKYTEDPINDFQEDEDLQALTEIRFTLSDNQVRHIIHCETAHDAWEKIKAIHQHSSESNRMFLMNQFLSLMMKENERVHDFIRRIENLADQISNLNGERIKDENKSLILSRGMPDQYTMVIIAIQQMNKLSDYEHVKTSLINEETRRGERNNQETADKKAFYTQRGKQQGRGRGRGNQRGGSTKFDGNCRFCGIYGHKEYECRKKQGDQGNNQGNNNQGPSGNNQGDSFNNTQRAYSYRGGRHSRGNFRGNFRGNSRGNHQANYGHNQENYDQNYQSNQQGDYAFTATAFTATNGRQWIMDSGASQHMTFERDLLTNYEKFKSPVPIQLGNDSVIHAEGKGTISMALDINNKQEEGTLTKVFYVPQIRKNLFSVGKVINDGLTLYFEGNEATFYRRDKPVMTASRRNDIYYINGKTSTPIQVNLTIAKTDNDTHLWHRRLGHVGFTNLQHMVENNSVKGLPDLVNDPGFCEDCALNKLTRLPFPTGGNIAPNTLDIIHSDICGPMNTLTHSGNKYFITFIDDHSRKAFVYFIKTKNEAYSKFQEFKAQVENETGHRIKILRTDGGGEYINGQFKELLKNQGIRHQVTAPYTPQQNGVAERFNRTVVEMARMMLHGANLPYAFWAESINTATYIRNRCISKALGTHKTTPEEVWTGIKPNIEHLRVFGCDAYALIKDHHHKLHPKGEKCILVGYETNSKAYRLWNHAKHKIIISRDVKFNEPTSQLVPSSTIIQEIETIDANDQNDETDTIDQQEDTPPTITAKSKAKKRLAHQLETSLGSYWNKPTEPEQITFAYALTAASALTEPQTFEEAQASPDAAKWRKAMDEEYDSLIENKTWSLVRLPSNRNAINVRWLFKIKQKGDGTIERYKARLVAKGFNQTYGVDYDETYAPVFKFTSLRTILTIGATLDMEIHQMDVKTAFLNGEIDTDIYINQPPGYEKDTISVCKLNKGIYGLKQSPRLWNKRINTFLINVGFERCLTDPCVYHNPTDQTILAIYVDDIIIVAHSKPLERIKQELSNEFKMSDLGPISFILGISVNRDRQNRRLYLHQPRYIKTLLERFQMVDSKPMPTPADPSTRLVKPSTEENESIDVPYRQAIGALMYLMLGSRPDLSSALNKVAQYSSNFDNSHWTAVKRIIRYIKGTADLQLTLGKNDTKDSISLSASCDADWGGDLDDRRSTSGYIFFINNSVISWQSRKQASVATSSTQAEYQALSNATKEAVWLRAFLSEIGFNQSSATQVQQDNQSTIAIAHNPINNGRTKHIDIAHHHIREHIERNHIELQYCPTAEMIADAMTKPLPKAKFEWCRNHMGLCGAPALSR